MFHYVQLWADQQQANNRLISSSLKEGGKEQSTQRQVLFEFRGGNEWLVTAGQTGSHCRPERSLPVEQTAGNMQGCKNSLTALKRASQWTATWSVLHQWLWRLRPMGFGIPKCVMGRGFQILYWSLSWFFCYNLCSFWWCRRTRIGDTRRSTWSSPGTGKKPK